MVVSTAICASPSRVTSVGEPPAAASKRSDAEEELSSPSSCEAASPVPSKVNVPLTSPSFDTPRVNAP